MPKFLNTRGKTTLGIGICGRCGAKFSLDDLQPDPNYPGLRVCRKDSDAFDPYRLPQRAPDRITLPFTRPDFSFHDVPSGFITEPYDEFILTEDSENYIVFFDEDDL